MLNRQVFGAGEIIAIPLPNIGSMGGEYGRSEGATAENAVPFPGAARRLLNLLSTDRGDAATRLDDEALAKTRLTRCHPSVFGPQNAKAIVLVE